LKRKNHPIAERRRFDAHMKKVSMYEENSFKESGLSRLLVHDSPYFKILNFNFKAGQELPLHLKDR